MTSYLENKLELLNASQRKLDDEKHAIEVKKRVLENEKHAIEEQIILEIEKNNKLKMNGTIIKFETQINVLSEIIKGNIMPNNIKLVRYQTQKDFKKELDQFNILIESEKIFKNEIRNKSIILERKRGLRDEIQDPQDDDKFITLEKFKDNLNKVNDMTIKGTHLKYRTSLLEIKPEIKIYDDIIPIFSTMIGIMKKQQEEIKELQSKNKSRYTIQGAVH